MDCTPSNYLSVAYGLEYGGLAISIIIIISLSFLERNKNGGRPGIVTPINFLHDDRLAYVYAAAFGCSSNQLVNLIFGKNKLSEKFPRLVYPWIRVLVWMLLALIVCVKFYPLFAVIKSKKRLIEPIIGLFYTTYLFAVFIYKLVEDFSTPNTFTSPIISYIPNGICYLILLCYFLYTLIAVVRKNHEEKEELWFSHHQQKYVKWLLRKPEEEDLNCSTDGSSFRRSLLTYRKDIERKFEIDCPLRPSPRVISTFVVAALAMYLFGIQLVTIYAELKPSVVLKQKLSNLYTNATVPQYITTLFTVMDVGFYISFTLSSIIMVIYVFLIFVNYRKDLIQMHRGDFSFLPMKLRKTMNDNLVAASLRYSGTQIAYLLWSYILMMIGLWVGCFLVAYLIILPLTGDVPMYLFELVPLFLPVIIINWIFRKIQVLVSRKYFLQDHSIKIPGKTETQKALALNNIKAFNVTSFLMFFFHAIIGFISSINRIWLSLIIGVVSLARIDRCMLPKGFEKYDKGYSTYIGMIMIDVYHRNPIMTVFCDELLSRSKTCTNMLLTPVDPEKNHRIVKKETTNQRHRRICRRWQKAYTLLCNPSLRCLTTTHVTECGVEQVEIVL